MALTGFPEQIKVTLGSLWIGGGRNSLNEDDELILKRIGASDYWSDGRICSPSRS